MEVIVKLLSATLQQAPSQHERNPSWRAVSLTKHHKPWWIVSLQPTTLNTGLKNSNKTQTYGFYYAAYMWSELFPVTSCQAVTTLFYYCCRRKQKIKKKALRVDGSQQSSTACEQSGYILIYEKIMSSEIWTTPTVSTLESHLMGKQWKIAHIWFGFCLPALICDISCLHLCWNKVKNKGIT